MNPETPSTSSENEMISAVPLNSEQRARVDEALRPQEPVVNAFEQEQAHQRIIAQGEMLQAATDLAKSSHESAEAAKYDQMK